MHVHAPSVVRKIENYRKLCTDMQEKFQEICYSFHRTLLHSIFLFGFGILIYCEHELDSTSIFSRR